MPEDQFVLDTTIAPNLPPLIFDLILRGGTVVDGTGAGPRVVDVGVSGDTISCVDDLSLAQADRELDVSGLVVAPGFVDAHTHTDLTCFQEHALSTASIRQGVTTEICGNCGFSPFPFAEGRREELRRHVGALLGPRAYADLGRWKDAVEEQGLYSNLLPLVGHGSVRAGVMGFVRRAPRADELDEMVTLARDAIERGAAGFSSGLIYSPGTYAQTAEVTELCRRVLHGTGRPYVTHVRGETHMVATAVDEALEIGRDAGVPVHLSHHKIGGRENWGRSQETLGRVADARARGHDVSLDVYPYAAASTLLSSLLPPWVQEGGRDPLLGRLRRGSVRRTLELQIAEGLPGWENVPRAAGWEGVVVASAPSRPECEGRSIADLADAESGRPLDYVADLLLENEGQVIAVLHLMEEGDVRNIVEFEGAMIGSDGLPLPGKPHPRLAGTFVRVLGRYAREERVLSLVDAVRKMTALPAERFGLHDRGTIAPGKIADLVVFSAEEVIDRATFADPLLTPAGVVHVVVDGRVAMVDGKLTDVHAGTVLTAGQSV